MAKEENPKIKVLNISAAFLTCMELSGIVATGGKYLISGELKGSTLALLTLATITGCTLGYKAGRLKIQEESEDQLDEVVISKIRKK